MRVTVVGAGRLGSALAKRSISLGHKTRILVRNAMPSTEISSSELCQVEMTENANSNSEDDLLIIAAPGCKDVESESQISALLNDQPRSTLIASAVSYFGAPHERWSEGRRYVRFLATPAAGQLRSPPILILDSPAPSCPELLSWFGPCVLGSGNATSFDAEAKMLMATPLILAVLDHVIEPGGNKAIALATLCEAQSLLSIAENDPAAAANLCATPDGTTERLLPVFHAALNTAFQEGRNNGLL